MASSPGSDLRASQQQIRGWRSAEESVGFVPTMGALHEGHLSLIGAAKARCQRVLVSVYVNEKQFGPSEDYSAYPRQPEEDERAARAAGADHVWVASQEEIYPADFATSLSMEGPALGFETADRPLFFGGIITVVARLFGLLRPDLAAFGEKDFQQLAVVRRLVQDLALPIEILGCPLIRDHDGLALSSRNAYLSKADRARALGLPTALSQTCSLFAAGNRRVADLEDAGKQVLHAHGLEPAYFTLVDPEQLSPLTGLLGADGTARILAAAHCGSVRLIDNCALDDPPWR